MMVFDDTKRTTELKNALNTLPLGLRTRFAPSPTGYLHLGHVLSAVLVWCVAKATAGHALLRIEDHDRSRWRQIYEDALRADLAWLGLVFDEVQKQSEHPDRYERALRRLSQTYACTCSRRELVQSEAHELFYPGTCRGRALEAVEANAALRWTLPPEDDHAKTFCDVWCGPQVQSPWRQCGDLLLRDRLGQWTYQFAVAVDDVEDGIGLVLRGQDLLASTMRQRLLRRALGGKDGMVYMHHPLIMDDEEPGVKLSKIRHSTGIHDMRLRGTAPEEVLGEAFYRAGFLTAPRPLALATIHSFVKAHTCPR